MPTPIIAELTVVSALHGFWCPHCLLSTAVETKYIATRQDRPDLPPVGRGRTVECDRCERELIEPEVEIDPDGDDPALFTFAEVP